MIKKKGITIPILYLFIYSKIREKATHGIQICHSDLKEIMRRRLHKIPRHLHYIIIKEMEELKLIKKVGNTKNLKYICVGKDIDKCLSQYGPII